MFSETGVAELAPAAAAAVTGNGKNEHFHNRLSVKTKCVIFFIKIDSNGTDVNKSKKLASR